MLRRRIKSFSNYYAANKGYAKYVSLIANAFYGSKLQSIISFIHSLFALVEEL